MRVQVRYKFDQWGMVEKLPPLYRYWAVADEQSTPSLMLSAWNKEEWEMSIKVQDWPEEKNEQPCWIGFEVGTIEEERERRIEVTDEEARAGYWLVMGWDVGFLPNGVADPAAVKWIDAVGGKNAE